MRAGVLILLCLLYSSFTIAKVYKWVDENGVTHYSENKPEGKTTTQIKVKGMSESDDDEAQNKSVAKGVNCEMIVRNGIKLLKEKIMNSGAGNDSFNDMLNDPEFVQQGVDECLTEKRDPVKAVQLLCQQNSKSFEAFEACEA